MLSMPWGSNDPYAPVGLLEPTLALLSVLAAGKWNLMREDPVGDIRGAKMTESLVVIIGCLAKHQGVGQEMISSEVLAPLVKVRMCVELRFRTELELR